MKGSIPLLRKLIYSLTIISTVFTLAVQAEDFVVGFAQSSDEVDQSVAVPHNVFFRVAHAATSEALTSAVAQSIKPGGASSEFKLVLSDSLKVSSDYTRWSLRLRPQVAFHSLRKVTINDVIDSISSCQKRGLITGIKSLESDREVTRYGDAFWVHITLDKGSRSVDEIKNFPRELSNCAIYPTNLAAIFGKEWGKGTSLVGTGPYRIVDFIKGSSITLARFQSHRRRGISPDTVILRQLKMADQGLSALRVGSIGAFFTEDSQVLKQAKEDETLVVDRCSKSNVIFRRNVHFKCENELDLFELRYVS